MSRDVHKLYKALVEAGAVGHRRQMAACILAIEGLDAALAYVAGLGGPSMETALQCYLEDREPCDGPAEGMRDGHNQD